MNNNYKYTGMPLTPSIAQELIKEAFSGKTATRSEIVEAVVQIHDERGGLPSEAKNVRGPIQRALQNLKTSGISENPSRGYWQINLIPDFSEREAPESIEPPPTPDEEEVVKHNDYEYVGVPLIPKIAQELIIEKFSGKTVKRQKIVETVVQIHCDRGGLPSEAQNVPEITIYPALYKLKKSGIAENPSQGYWRISLSPDLPEREVPESVELPQALDEAEIIKHNDYEYVGVPLIPKIAQELIIEKFSGKTVNRQEIIETVIQIHCDRGGLPSEAQNVPETTIYAALYKLKKSGIAENPSQGYWRIDLIPDSPGREGPESVEPPQAPDEEEIIEPDVPSEIGSGEDSVYLYYLPLYRKEAQSKGESVWPCKVGRTRHDPVRRVRAQTSAPEEPELALTIRTDTPSDMEKAIHAILAVRGRHMEHAQGTEWFHTNPSEVEEIHAFIVAV